MTPQGSGPPRLFDAKLIERRRERAMRLGAATFLLDRAAEDLAERLALVSRRFKDALDLASPTDAARSVLAGLGVTDVIALELSPAIARRRCGPIVIGSPEASPFAAGSRDLIVSCLSLHLIDDLPGALAQARRILRPDGLFLAALLGGETLTELRQAFAAAEAEVEGGVSPRVIPFADVRDMGGLLQRAGFALPVTDVDRVVVRYGDVFALMRDLRAMGATNPLVERRRTLLRRATLLRMVEIYNQRFADPDGRLRATFDIVWLSGWAPHESQQKPLRPGSAKARLADALKAIEVPAGEKAGE